MRRVPQRRYERWLHSAGSTALVAPQASFQAAAGGVGGLALAAQGERMGERRRVNACSSSGSPARGAARRETQRMSQGAEAGWHVREGSPRAPTALASSFVGASMETPRGGA